ERGGRGDWVQLSGRQRARPRDRSGGNEREDLRLAGRGEDRLRTRGRPEPGHGNRPRGTGDEEGHSRLHRVGCAGTDTGRGSGRTYATRGARRSPAAARGPAGARSLGGGATSTTPGGTVAARRELRADDRDAQGNRGAHAPLPRHL